MGTEGAAVSSGDDLSVRLRLTRGRIDWARLAHRRAAARELDRLLGLPGYRDVRASGALVNGRLLLFCYGLDERWTLLRSPSWPEAKAWLATTDASVSWSRAFRGWRIRTDHVGDLLAQASIENVTVVMKGALPPQAAS